MMFNKHNALKSVTIAISLATLGGCASNNDEQEPLVETCNQATVNELKQLDERLSQAMIMNVIEWNPAEAKSLRQEVRATIETCEQSRAEQSHSSDC